MPRATQFTELFEDPVAADRASRLYNDINKVELFLAVIGERPVVNGLLGQLGSHIVAEQFKRTRDADSMWYEAILPKDLIDEIKGTTLIDIFQRNMVNFQDLNRDFSFLRQ